MRSCLGKKNSVTKICVATQIIFWHMSFRETRAKKCVGTQIITHKKLPKDTGKRKANFFEKFTPGRRTCCTENSLILFAHSVPNAAAAAAVAAAVAAAPSLVVVGFSPLHNRIVASEKDSH